jgi:hypothetical protein
MSSDWWSGNVWLPSISHKYTYAANNPATYVDRNGLQPEIPDPLDPAHCETWSYPRKTTCQLITNKNTSAGLRLSIMWLLYREITLGMEVSGKFDHAPDFWVHYLFSESNLGSGDISLEGADWGRWILTHPQDRAMHSQQLKDFFRYYVFPAAQRCETEVGPINFGRLNRNSDRGYRYVEAGSATHDVTVALGRHYLEGVFYAKNIQAIAPVLISADVTINRFIDDTFDFTNDGGGIPLHEILKGAGIPNILGYGYVPNVWANELAIYGFAYPFKIHIEWTEEFPYIWSL